MNTDELTLGQVKELMGLFGCKSEKVDKSENLPFSVGDRVLIRTVTMIQVGRVKHIDRKFLTLEDAGWVADTGRFGECLSSGSLSEFERAPSWVYVNREGIIDMYPWEHTVPSESK